MSLPPLCVLGQTASRTYYELARLESMTQWWHWLLLAAVCGAVATTVGVLYSRDSVELSRGLRWLLVSLRMFAFLAILLTFLDLQKRTERREVQNSRVVLGIDTSQSMALRDSDSSSTPTGPSRIQHVATALGEGTLLAQLREKHDVVVTRFDQNSQPTQIASLKKLSAASDPVRLARQAVERSTTAINEARWLLAVAAGLLFAAVVFGLAHLVARRRATREDPSWALLASGLLVIFGLITLAVMNLRHPSLALASLVGLSEIAPVSQPSAMDQEDAATTAPTAEPVIDWQAELATGGTETRLGEAMRYLVNRELGGPVAGIVLISDGCSNAGVDPAAVIEAAAEANIPILTVGLGSEKRPLNVRIVDLEAPARVYPGDRFTVTGYVQAYGLEGRTVKVKLVSAPYGEDLTGDGPTPDADQTIRLGSDGDVLPLKFEIAPEQAGRRSYRLHVQAPLEDGNVRDNQRTVNVRIVDRKNRVLLFAGGPTREYRFLRNQLYRDRESTVDVLLQSGGPGISQDADEIIYDFPNSVDQLFEYDSIVAFDPDWRALSDDQVELLDRWVAEKAGGLIVIAGPVHTPVWSGQVRDDDRIDTIKALYPVVFYGQGSRGLGRFDAPTPSPIVFSDEAVQAPFLRLEDSAGENVQAWNDFDGVYSYHAVKNEKAGAKVYARLSDRQATVDDKGPIYMAGHFYGAGRVFFLASGEMWRLRRVDDAYFDQFYTKLIRYVSQGRLLRDSSRGVLMVDKDRGLLGDTIVVQAHLTDPQYRPLTNPDVTASLLLPDGMRKTMTLKKVVSAARQGMYAGQFTALAEGDYHLQLKVPDSDDEGLLTREVHIRIPDLEIERPERNDALLSEIAKRTGGFYYVGMDAALGRKGLPPLANKLIPQDQETYLPGSPDRDFERRLMRWLLAAICGALSLEWLFRRLSKLA